MLPGPNNKGKVTGIEQSLTIQTSQFYERSYLFRFLDPGKIKTLSLSDTQCYWLNNSFAASIQGEMQDLNKLKQTKADVS